MSHFRGSLGELMLEAVIFELDGTLSVEKERHYRGVLMPAHLEFLPGVVELLDELNAAGFSALLLSRPRERLDAGDSGWRRPYAGVVTIGNYAVPMIALVSRYSCMPASPHSRPLPERLKPPKGASS